MNVSVFLCDLSAVFFSPLNRTASHEGSAAVCCPLHSIHQEWGHYNIGSPGPVHTGIESRGTFKKHTATRLHVTLVSCNPVQVTALHLLSYRVSLTLN